MQLMLFALAAGALLSPASLDVPFVRQVRAGCGSAAIAMVMQYWVRQEPGLDAAAAAAEKIDRALPAGPKGLTGNALKTYLEDHQFSAFAFTATFEDLRQHLAKGRPVVACIAPKGPKAPLHFVVITGIDDTSVVFHDPARGQSMTEARSAFDQAWRVTNRWALLAVPQTHP